MKHISFLVSDEGFEAIQQIGDRKQKGRIWLENHDGKAQLRYEPYRQRNTKCTPIVVCIVVADASKLSVEPLNPTENGNI